MTTQKITETLINTPIKANGNRNIHALDSALQSVETVMATIVQSDVTVLRDASLHILGAGGKRIRPRLVFLSHMATGGTDFDDVARVAAAVELVHTASVVHDDINDHGVVRRGKASVNAIWGRTFALLTGDFLFTKVYELMAPYKDMNIILAEATVALVEGETLQAAAVKDKNFTREVYYDIIAKKTAALFKAGGILGATLSNAPQAHIDALGNFSFNIGLAFQIIDDLLDLTADSDQTGKTSGIDVEQGKGFASVQNGESSDPMDIIREKLSDEKTIAEGKAQAQNLVMMAIAELDVLPDTDAKQELIQLAESVIERDY